MRKIKQSTQFLRVNSSYGQEDDDRWDRVSTPSSAISKLIKIFFDQCVRNLVCGRSPGPLLLHTTGMLGEQRDSNDKIESVSCLDVVFLDCELGRLTPSVDVVCGILEPTSRFEHGGTHRNRSTYFPGLVLSRCVFHMIDMDVHPSKIQRGVLFYSETCTCQNSIFGGSERRLEARRSIEGTVACSREYHL